MSDGFSRRVFLGNSLVVGGGLLLGAVTAVRRARARRS